MSEKKKKTACKPEKDAQDCKQDCGEACGCENQTAAPENTADLLKAAEDKYLRLLAEFDNYRKRTAKEKQSFTENAVGDTVKKFLPLFDNLQRAISADGDVEAFRKGVEMVEKQFGDIITELGVKEIETESFDPNFHNAVLHVDDPEKGECEIVEVLQKGYKYGNSVLRHSMVKVAN